MEKITSLASAKRAMTVGSKWHFESHWFTGLREVTDTNSVGVTMTVDSSIRDSGTSTLRWPKSKDFEPLPEGDGFIIRDLNNRPMTYRRT